MENLSKLHIVHRNEDLPYTFNRLLLVLNFCQLIRIICLFLPFFSTQPLSYLFPMGNLYFVPSKFACFNDLRQFSLGFRERYLDPMSLFALDCSIYMSLLQLSVAWLVWFPNFYAVCSWKLWWTPDFLLHRFCHVLLEITWMSRLSLYFQKKDIIWKKPQIILAVPNSFNPFSVIT